VHEAVRGSIFGCESGGVEGIGKVEGIDVTQDGLRMARTTNVTVDAQMRLTMDNVRYGYGKAKCTALV
jgi:hypothetical protein